MSALAQVIDRSRREKESWRYTDLEALLNRHNSSGAPPRLTSPARGEERSLSRGSVQQSVCLLFVNGVLQIEKSRFGDLPQDIIRGDAAGGYKLSLAGQTCLVTSPVELFFAATEGAKDISTKLTVELGVSGRLTLIEYHEGGNASHVIETEINLDKQAKLVHGKIIRGDAGAHLARTKIDIKEGAYYDNFTLVKGGQLTRNEINAKLSGKLAQCNLNGAMLLGGHDHADTTTFITHAAPFGTSREFYKSVARGSAKAVFQGKIIVEEDAQKTDGHQLSRGLLLSDQAEIDAKPELEIYADDVKCSHGSTIGDLDEAAMFYLRARGIPEADARALLIEAFVGEILDQIHSNEIAAICRAEMEGWLHE